MSDSRTVDPLKWSIKDVQSWLQNQQYSDGTIHLLVDCHELDGKSLLSLSDQDFLVEPLVTLPLRERKLLSLDVRKLQRTHRSSLIESGIISELPSSRNSQVFSSNLFTKDGKSTIGIINRKHSRFDF